MLLFIKVEQKNLGQSQLKLYNNLLYKYALRFLLGHSTQERKFTSNYFIWMKAKQSKRFWKRLKLWTLLSFYGTLRRESVTNYCIFTIFQAVVIGMKPIFTAVFNRYTITLWKSRNINLANIKISIQGMRMFPDGGNHRYKTHTLGI